MQVLKTHIDIKINKQYRPHHTDPKACVMIAIISYSRIPAL